MLNLKLTPLLFLISSSSVFAVQNLFIENTDYSSSLPVNEWAEHTIQTAGPVTVENATDIRFSAGNTITLSSGFQVAAGGTFSASVSANPTYSPGGYYDNMTPSVVLLSGDQQYGQVGQFNSAPFDIAVWNADGTAPLVGAPVLVTISIGAGMLSATNGPDAVLSQSLNLTTDVDGTVQAYYMQGGTPGYVSIIQVVVGGQVLEFVTISSNTATGNDDSNGDGIPDAWEMYYYGTINVPNGVNYSTPNTLSAKDAYAMGVSPLIDYSTSTSSETIFTYTQNNEMATQTPASGTPINYAPDSEGNLGASN